MTSREGRFFSPQPNVTGVGILASYSRRFWAVVIVLGVVTGAGAAALTALLRLVERVTYGVHARTLLAAVRQAPDWRRVVALLAAAVIVIAGLRVLGRRPTGGTEVSESLWLRSGRLDFVPSIARAVLSIITVGMGVSLGREAAPQLVGAATGSQLCDWAEVPVWQRRLLVAAGAGAGFSAVYNVPLGGTLVALEVMLGTLALPLVVPALLCSVIATSVAWVTLGTGPIYHVAAYGVHPSQLVFAMLLGPVIGAVAAGWTRLIRAANRMKPSTAAGRYTAPVVAFGLLGVLSIPYPQLLGNGRGIVQLTIVGGLSVGVMAVLIVLKPLVTAACVGSGAPGGLFTPTLALGVLFAGLVGHVFGSVWQGGAAPGSYALIGGGAFLAASMQGPLSGIVLVLELSRHFDALMVPTLLAVAVATIIARRLGVESIYAARLGGAGEDDPQLPATTVMDDLDEATATD